MHEGSSLAVSWPLLALTLGCGAPQIVVDAPEPTVDSPSESSSDSPVAAPELPGCTDGVLKAFDAERIQPPAAGSDSFTLPSNTMKQALTRSIESLVSGSIEEALEGAAQAGYRLCRGEGDEAALVLWEPESPGTGRPVFVLRTEGARALILEAPHSWFDTDTMIEGRSMFGPLQARVLLSSGAHRCSSSTLSGCDGTTGTCGSSGPYTESDPAHSVETAFHAVHESLGALYPDDVVLGLHGMAAEGISLSDGTSYDVDEESFLARLAEALTVAYASSNVASCNDYEGANVDRRLCGSTDVQGRQLNGSPIPCTEAASSSGGRYIHIEQDLGIRRDPEALIGVLDELLP